MHMKKATAHIDDLTVARKYNIRFTWQILLVQTEAIAHPVNNRAHNNLRFGVATTDSRHVIATLCWRQDIDHI
jgi:hypothetical protein